VTAPSYAISASPTSQTIQAGQSAQFTITVAPAGGFSSTVNFSCGTLPGETTCSFSPSTVAPNGGPASTTLTISTTASTAKLEPHNSPWIPASGLALAGVLGLSLRRRRRYSWMMRVLSSVFILSAVITAVGGCGGGGNMSDGGGGNSGTPVGSYTVSVSASASGEPAQGLQLSLMVN
jgi:LPXTG-motif cell wall-anchored protein